MIHARREVLAVEAPLGAAAAALVGLSFLFAATGIPGWIPPAAVVRAGLASPLTGMTRSFVALARGDLAGSLAWHPLGPLAFAACVAAVAVAVISCARGRRSAVVARALGNHRTWVAVAAVVAIVWIRQIAAIGV